MKVTLEPLTAERFAPFGHVIAPPAEPGRIDISDLLENRREHARPALTLTHAAARALPIETGVMERHRFSAQSFVPVEATRYVVLVAPHLPREQRPDLSLLRAFVATGAQGIVYRPDVWHHPMTALDRPAKFAVTIWRDGGADDEEFVDLPETLTISG